MVKSRGVVLYIHEVSDIKAHGTFLGDQNVIEIKPTTEN